MPDLYPGSVVIDQPSIVPKVAQLPPIENLYPGSVAISDQPQPHRKTIGEVVSGAWDILNKHPTLPEPSKETTDQWSPTTQKIVGGALGVGEALVDQITPANIGLILSGAGLVRMYPAIAPLIKGALPVLFGASMVKQGAQTLGEVAGTPASQTTPMEQAKKVGEGVTTAGLGALGVAEPGVAEIKKPGVSITKEPVVSPEQLAKIKAAQPQYQQIDTTPKAAKQQPQQTQNGFSSAHPTGLRSWLDSEGRFRNSPDEHITEAEKILGLNFGEKPSKEVFELMEKKNFIRVVKDNAEKSIFIDSQKYPSLKQLSSLKDYAIETGYKLIFDYGGKRPENIIFDPENEKFAPQQFPAERRAKEQLGLTKPSTAGDVARHIAERGDATIQQKEFASFLDRHFSHILDFAGVEPGENPYGGRAAYIYSGPDSHKIYMDLKENGYNAVDTFLHEAAHAAMHWVYENPATAEQRLAKADIDKLMELTVDSLPKAVKEFYNGQFKTELAKSPQMSFDKIQTMFEAHGLDVHKWYTTLYALQDGSEFIAGVFGDHRFREFLDNIRVENKDSVFRRIYSAIMSALGIKPGTALEKSFDTFMQMGEGSREKLPGQLEQVRKRFVGEVGVKNMPQLPSEDKGGLPAEDVIWLGDTLFTDLQEAKKGQTRFQQTKNWFKKEIEQKLNQIAKVSAPKTIAVSKDLGNALVRYASARYASPLIAKATASAVLGEHWNDPKGFDKAGAAIVEHNLETLRQSYMEKGEKDKAAAIDHVWEQEETPFKTKTEYQAALKDPQVKATMERYKKLVSLPSADIQKKLGGKVLPVDVFANLIALKDAKGNIIERAPIGSGTSRQGRLENPLKRGTAFNKERKGTAKQYDFNVRNMIEHTIMRNYEESTKSDMYDVYVKSGLGVVWRAGEEKPKIPESFSKQPITIRSKIGRETLFVRNDIAAELRQTLQTDSPIENGVKKYLISGLVNVQVAGPADAMYHVINDLAAIAGSQGGSVSVMKDMFRKVPGIRELDTVARVAVAWKNILLNTPEIQAKLAELARVGSERGEVYHQGVIGDLFQTGKFIRMLDKSTRLALFDMYHNLVERGWVEKTEEGLREFVNKAGQYNTRLMGRIEAMLKESGVSPFIVAGKNFNRLALQRLMLNPGVRAANWESAAKLRIVDALGLIASLAAIPMAVNYYNTGSIWGRPGIKPGAVDLGGNNEKGQPKELDLVQNILVRRGLGNTGIEVAYKDAKQGLSEREMLNDAFMDIVRGYFSPLEGPATSFIGTVLTGRDRSGYLVSENYKDKLGANLYAALKSANPSIAKLFQAEQEGTSKTVALASPLIQATGYSVGRKPGLYEQEMQVPGLEKQTLKERAATQKTFQKQDRSEMTPQQKEQLKEDEENRATQVEAQLNKELKPDTQQWLKAQHLQVPGFAEYLTQTGVRVYLLPKEREQYMSIMVSSYEDAIRKAKPFVERQTTQEMKEKVLQGFIKSAHGVARNKMRNLIGKEE